jgi:hypothetical protein
LGFNLVFLQPSRTDIFSFGVKTRYIRLNVNERGVVQNINIQNLKGVFLPSNQADNGQPDGVGAPGRLVENNPRGSLRNGIVIFDNCFE